MPLKKIPAIRIADLARLYHSEWKAQGLFVSSELSLLRGVERPIRTEGFVIGICSRGSAVFELDLQRYPAGRFSLLATTPRHLYRLAEISEDFLCRFIVFSKAFLQANNIHLHLLESFCFFDAAAAPVWQLKEEKARELLDFLGLMEQKFSGQEQPYRLEIIRNLLLAFLYETAGAYQQQGILSGRKPGRKEELTVRFQHLLFRHFKEERRVHFYAGKLFVSPKYLSETIKEVTGRPASKWIEEAVILEAKALLELPAMNVAKVAEALNFPNQSFFGKYFKKYTGKSPSDYLHAEAF